MQKHPSSTSLNKGVFPSMLNNLIEALGMRSSTNLKSGFRACGIVPLNSEAVLRKLPSAMDTDTGTSKATADVSDVVLNYLHQFKYSPHGKDVSVEKVTVKRKRLPVSPGKSVSVIDGNSTRITSDPQPSISAPLQPSTSAPLQPSTSRNGPTCRRSFQASAAGYSDSEDNMSFEHNSDSFLTDLTDDDEDWVPQPAKHHRR